MAKYGYDEKIGELIPQDIYEEYSLCALYSGLGIEFNDYMTEIVSKMLLAKNVALSNDKIKILADNIRKNQQEDDPKKEKENYLASYMVEKDGKVIDNLEEMREFVKENFLFVLQDDDQENAWISSKKDGVKLLSVSKNMLDFAENSSQIEGVVAHELGHYFLRKAYEKVSNSNIDETLADKHAVDMLYYLGKDPDEYRKVLERVLKLNEMNDVEAVILGVIDEHGSPKHRIQTIEDYEEVKYGDYIENFLEDAEKIEKVALDDASFMDFKGRIDKEYDEGKYIGYLEAKFMEDDKFSSKIVEGRIDWANVSYDDALDKLIELCNDENFKHSIRLAEAGKILSMSDTSSIVRDENHASKASKFFMRATDCVFLSIDKKGKSLREVRVDEAFEQIKKNDYKYNLSRVLLDEANEKGEELDAKGLVKKMEEVLAENGVVLEGTGEQSVNYNGRELYCGGYYDIRLLALSLDDDTKVLSEDIKNHRAIYAKSSIRGMIDEFDAMGIDNNRAKFISNADSLAFSLAYPDLDLGKYESKYYKCINDKQKSECEEKFFNIVYNSEPIRLELPAVFEEYEKKLTSLIEGKSGHHIYKNHILGYSTLALKIPEFVMPKMEEAVGKTLPWSKLIEEADDKKFLLQSLVQLGVGIDEGVLETQAQNEDICVVKPKKFKEVISKVKFDGEPYEFMADENGNIIAVGEEVKELKEKKSLKKQFENDEKISSCFDTQIKVYEALITLGEYSKALIKTPELTAEAAKSLDYVLRVENIEAYIFTIGVRDSNIKPKVDERRDLDYSNMGNDEARINRDYEKLKASKLYKLYGKEDERELTIEDKKKEITDFMNLRLKDRTGEALEIMKDPMIRVLERKENARTLIDEVAYGVSRIKSGDENEDKKISKVVLDIYDYLASKKNYEKGSCLWLTGAQPEKNYVDEKIKIFEEYRKKIGFIETKGNPEALYENLTKKSEEENQKGANLAVCCAYNDNYMPEYEVLRYINDKDNPKVDIIKLLDAYPRIEARLFTGIDNSSEFNNKLSEYVLENGYKELSFKEQKKAFDLMAHKRLFGEENRGMLVFLEELKKSYQALPENEKEEAALLMLKDKVFEYEGYEKSWDRSKVTVESKKNEISAMGYAPIRNYFVEEYVDKLVSRIGKEPVEGDVRDDGSIVSKEDVEEYRKKVIDVMDMTNNEMGVGNVKDKLFEVLADKIEAQRELSERFEVEVQHKDNDRDLGFRNEASARVVSSLNDFLDICSEGNLDVINFLTEPYSKEGCEKFKNNLYQHVIDVWPKFYASYTGEEEKPVDQEFKDGLTEQLNKFSNDDLLVMHAEFWDMELNERAAVMQRCLKNYAGTDVNKMVDLVVSRYIEKDAKYVDETKDVLNALYAKPSEDKSKGSNRKEYYRKNKARFMLGAMLSAKEPSKDSSESSKKMGVGEALAQFCSSNGPAWVKFGQALSNVPSLPDDIRRPMAVLKDNAVKKKRWEIFSELRENVGTEKLDEIRKVGKLLGAGSFFSSLAVEFDNGDKNVLQMMRPRAKQDADSEFKKIMRTVKDLAEKDSMYSVLGTIVDRANESTKTEVDIKRGYDQYVEAYKSYNAIEKLEVNGVKFNLKLCPWTDWSYDEKTGAGFKAMEFGDGKSLPKLDCSEEEKKIIAAGYVATELGILISGRSWDIDRHSGQQNFDIKRDKDGKIKEVDINIFDTGALRKPPTEEEKMMIANFYASVIRASVKGEDINDVMFREVNKLEEKKVDAGYVSDVQRGSIALADIVEYQKEEKNNNGEVVKPSKSLSQDDFVKIFSAVIVSGLVDHKIMDNLVSKLVKDKGLLFELAKQEIKKKMAKLGKKSEKSEEQLDVTMEAKTSLEQKRENQRIDEELKNSKDNPFTRTNKYSSLTKEERQEVVKKERKGNKFSRNLQAWYLKKTRSSK